MKSLSYTELQNWTRTATFAGDYCYISQGQVRHVLYHANWPQNRHELLSAMDARALWYHLTYASAPLMMA